MIAHCDYILEFLKMFKEKFELYLADLDNHVEMFEFDRVHNKDVKIKRDLDQIYYILTRLLSNSNDLYRNLVRSIIDYPMLLDSLKEKKGFTCAKDEDN